MTGLTPFSIEDSENFKRSFKKLAKIHGKSFITLISSVLEDLLENPYPNNSRNEPLPGKVKLPQEWTFHKLAFKFAKGASGQIRLMYLVNEEVKIIKPIWIYSHEQFAKRPGDKELRSIIKQIFLED